MAKIKSAGFYLLPVPYFEAFTLLSVVERATSKPTPIYIYTSPNTDIRLIARLNKP